MAKFRIRELAQERKLTQEDLSRRSGVTLSTIQRLWQNKSASEPRASTMRNIAKALEVGVDDLYNPESSTDEGALPRVAPENPRSLVFQTGSA